MSLVVRYFTQLHPHGQSEPYEPFTFILTNEDFPGREGNLKAGVKYSYSEARAFSVGVDYSFNLFRNDLAELSGWPLDETWGEIYNGYASSAWKASGGPFWELINFSDGHGTLGTEICSKLAADFAGYQYLADSQDNPFFSLSYYQWREAFEVASNGGAVVLTFSRNSNLNFVFSCV